MKQGDKIQWHFAHASFDASGCSGGGESLQHRAAKMIIARHISQIYFVQKCSEGWHRHVRRYEGCTTIAIQLTWNFSLGTGSSEQSLKIHFLMHLSNNIVPRHRLDIASFAFVASQG